MSIKRCPKCLYHKEPIFTIEISPLTSQRWRVERCPNCLFGYDLILERDYIRQTKKQKNQDNQLPPSGWMFGL